VLESGFVRIYRSLLNWEWYDDANTMRVFLHLILTAQLGAKKVARNHDRARSKGVFTLKIGG
jgi:hypothetical protein